MYQNFVIQALVLVLVTSCLPLIICSVNSIIIASLQTVMQIQDQTLSYLVRLMTIIVIFYFCSSWFWREYINFFELSLSGIESIGKIK